MTHRIYRIVFMLISISTLMSADNTGITPYFSIRSQGLNTPRHLSGTVPNLFVDYDAPLAGTFSTALAYTRSFDSDTITNCLFGTCACPTISISGSRVADRSETDWLADYFYLPTDYKSTLSFNPTIDNLMLDLNFRIDLNEWVKGLYVAFYAPIVHSRWDLNMCETVEMKGTNTHAPGYFSPATIQRNDLLNNFTEYAQGAVAGPITQTVAGDEYTITLFPLNQARISPNSLNQTRAADLRTVIGYDCIKKDRFVCGIQGLVTAPTGNRPEGEYLFEPMIGNGHHWELGGAVQATAAAWKSDDEQKQLVFHANLSVMHLFSARQRRTFDLKNKPLSRYMLIERLETPIRNNLKGDGKTPSGQFRNEFTPVANLTNVCVDVSSSVQAEFTAFMTLVYNNISWDIGYNLWARSCENIQLRDVTEFENNTKWALKGDAHVFGFDRSAAGTGPLVGAVALSATQNNATIESGTNFTSERTTAQAILNPGIDNPKDATGDGSGGSNNNPLSAEPNAAALTIKTSIEPVFIAPTDLDVCKRKTRGSSSKLFTNFSYTWNEHEAWLPYLAFGGEVEFNHNSTNCATSCSSCISCALSQWGVWLKGGMSF